jgi:Methyltransferase FkbM domain
MDDLLVAPKTKDNMENINTMIKTKIKKIGRTVGLYISRSTTDRQLLEDLVKKFRPIDSGVKLIRLGGNYDGGYLVPDDMEGIKYSFSPGVSNLANFEFECLEKGIVSFLADYSVDKPPLELAGCHFLKKFVGAYNNEQTITLEKWVADSLPKEYQGDLLLQMDIEGSEYETLLATPYSIMERFRIIVLEFHNFHILDNKEYYHLVNSTIEKLREYFEPVHLHINNFEKIVNVNGVLMPGVIEVTFLRKDRIKGDKKPAVLPHPLDQPNNPKWVDPALPDSWK